MKIIFTDQALERLLAILEFLSQEASYKKAHEVRDYIFEAVDQLPAHPEIGQMEPYLEHLGRGHRRIVVNYYKIIYRLEGDKIYITDIFDTRQDPSNMKS